MPEAIDQTSHPRRRRNREHTRAALRASALDLLERNGVLAGLNLQEVGQRAGVNRAQIYQYYGSRQALLRAAIAEMFDEQAEDRTTHRTDAFAERRRATFKRALQNPQMVKLQALLAQDRDEQFSFFPELDKTLLDLEKDRQSEALPLDADGLAMHVMTAATYAGYCIFREVFARDTDIPLAELDDRALAVFEQMLTSLAPDEPTAS